MTVAELLRLYQEEITPAKRSAPFERSRIKFFLSQSIAQERPGSLSGASVAHYRDTRLKSVKPATVRRELVIFRHVFEAEIGVGRSANEQSRADD